MDKELLSLIIKNQADIWLKENPLLLNSQEKQKFLIGLQDYLANKNIAIDDEVFDFLVQRKLVDNEPREESFKNYLIKKYGSLKQVKVLDVGAGRTCPLSRAIAQQGAVVTAMDMNIRLSSEILRKERITPIKKMFRCDEYSKKGLGTNIDKFDLIVGLEPCDATEHIIRQSLKYDKAFDINLCASQHKALDGTNFNTYQEWYQYLKNISKEVSIVEHDCGFVATNCEDLEL